MTRERPDVAPIQAPLGELERTLIEEFLRAHGYDPLQLSALPDAGREALLSEASVYASARLAEIDSRSHFLHDIHVGGTDLKKPHGPSGT